MEAVLPTVILPAHSWTRRIRRLFSPRYAEIESFCRPKGPAVRRAQANGLGYWLLIHISPNGAAVHSRYQTGEANCLAFSLGIVQREYSQGVAPGYANCWPLGPRNACRGQLPRLEQSASYTPMRRSERILPVVGVGIRGETGVWIDWG